MHRFLTNRSCFTPHSRPARQEAAVEELRRLRIICETCKSADNSAIIYNVLQDHTVHVRAMHVHAVITDVYNIYRVSEKDGYTESSLITVTTFC